MDTSDRRYHADHLELALKLRPSENYSHCRPSSMSAGVTYKIGAITRARLLQKVADYTILKKESIPEPFPRRTLLKPNIALPETGAFQT